MTGAAGFIGSHVTDALVERGDEVYGVDNFETGLRSNVTDLMSFQQEDITNWTGPDPGLDVDVVLHAAATYKDPNAWERDLEVNAEATANVSGYAATLGAHLIYLQTSLCYGPPLVSKTAGEQYARLSGWTSLCYGPPLEQPITLGHPLNPKSSYAISKTAGEQYARLSGCDLTVFRLANMYGPRNLSGPVPAFYKRMAAGETCTIARTRRDFVYIDDLVNLILKAIDGRVLGTYHASTGADYPISDVFNAVAEAGGFPSASGEFADPGSDDVKTLLLDPSVTEQTFGWKASTPLDDGIRAAVDWYRANGVGETYTHLAAV